MGRKPKTTIWSLKDEEEASMKMEQETNMGEVMEEKQTEQQDAMDLHNVKLAYCLMENEGKYHVVSVEFDANKLIAGKVKKIESNTDKFLMQERLQVLLMGDDLI